MKRYRVKLKIVPVGAETFYQDVEYELNDYDGTADKEAVSAAHYIASSARTDLTAVAVLTIDRLGYTEGDTLIPDPKNLY